MNSIHYREDKKSKYNCITCAHYKNRRCQMFQFEVSPINGYCNYHRNIKSDAQISDGKIKVNGEVLPMSLYGEPPTEESAIEALEKWESNAPSRYKNILQAEPINDNPSSTN